TRSRRGTRKCITPIDRDILAMKNPARQWDGRQGGQPKVLPSLGLLVRRPLAESTEQPESVQPSGAGEVERTSPLVVPGERGLSRACRGRAPDPFESGAFCAPFRGTSGPCGRGSDAARSVV